MGGRLRILNMPDVTEAGLQPGSVPASLLQARPASLFPCVGCPGHCCHHRVRVTAVEAFRITLTLGLPMDQVVTRLPYQQGSPHRLERPPILINGEPLQLELLRTGDAHRCLFLFSVGSEGRCGIYGLRPALCRLFPYDLELDGARIQTGDQAWCPTSWLKDAVAELQVRASLGAQRRDLRREKALLAAWEAAPGPRDWAAFLTFGARRLARYLGVDPRMEQAHQPRERRRLKPALW